jgi:hypothetical protein
MCTPFEVFEAPWRELAKWGFWHVDHWVFYRTEQDARDAADYLRQRANRGGTPSKDYPFCQRDPCPYWHGYCRRDPACND